MAVERPRGRGAILHASQQLESWDGLSEPLVAGIDTMPCIDCSGDIATLVGRIATVVQAAVDLKGIPVVLGGEHTVSLAPIRALHRTCPQPIGIIQLDAHAVEECGCRLYQFEVRALCREEVDYRRTHGVHYLDARAIASTNLAEFMLPPDFPQNIYLTLDEDGLDPSVIGATGTPVSGGPG